MPASGPDAIAAIASAISLFIVLQWVFAFNCTCTTDPRGSENSDDEGCHICQSDTADLWPFECCYPLVAWKMEPNRPYSIVCSADDMVYQCPYCKTEKGCSSFSFWAYSMTPEDYQALINKGFCRSGKTIYMPLNFECCCPQVRRSAFGAGVSCAQLLHQATLFALCLAA